MTSDVSERSRAATDAIGGPAEPWRFHVVTVHVRATVVIADQSYRGIAARGRRVGDVVRDRSAGLPDSAAWHASHFSGSV